MTNLKFGLDVAGGSLRLAGSKAGLSISRFRAVSTHLVDLSVAVEVISYPVFTTDTGEFLFTVENSGPYDTTNLVVTTSLPSMHLSYVSHNASQGSYVSVTGLWTVGSLPAGQSATLSVTTSGVNAGTYNVAAAVSGKSQLDNIPMNDYAELEIDTVIFNPTGDIDSYSSFWAEDELWTNKPVVAYTSEDGLFLPGVAANYASVPDNALLDITGDITLVARVAMTDWTPGATQVVLGKWTSTSNQRSYSMSVQATSGVLRVDASPDGLNNGLPDQFNSGVAPTVSDGATLWIAATLTTDDGAGNRAATFWTSTDGVTWALLGSQSKVGVAATYSSTAPLEFGAFATGSASNLNGTVSVARVYSGSGFDSTGPVGSTLVLDSDFRRPRTPTFAATSAYGVKNGTGLVLPGLVDNYATVPNAAPLQITGDIDVCMRMAATDWTPGSITYPISKLGLTGTRAWDVIFAGTYVAFRFSPDGSTVTQVLVASTPQSVLVDGAAAWWRITRNATTGDVMFFTAPDSTSEPTTWTQRGATAAGAAGAIFAGTVNIGIGAQAVGSAGLAGTYMRAIVKDGIGGTTVLDTDFTTPASDVQSFTATTGQTVSILGTTPTVTVHSGRAVDRWRNAGTLRTSGAHLTADGLVLPGVAGNYASVPDAAALDIVGDITLVAKATLTDWTPSNESAAISKYLGSGNQRSYMLTVSTAGALRFYWSSNGSTQNITASTAVTSFADGATGWIAVSFDVDNGAVGNDAKFWTSSDGITWAQLGTTVTTAGVASIHSGAATGEFGSFGSGVSYLLNGTIHEAQVYSGADFDTDGPGGTPVLDVDFTAATPGATSFTASTGQTVTVLSTFSANHATGSFQPTYRGSVAALNDRPAVDFDGTDDRLEIVSGVSLAQPFSVVWIGTADTVAANRRIAGLNSAGTGQAVGLTSTPNWSAQMGAAALAGGTPVADTAYMARFLLNNASSVIAVNGSAVATGTVNGTLAVDQIILGAGRSSAPAYAQFQDGKTAFLGIFPGDITTSPRWPAFKRWCSSYYGITIS